MAKTSMINREAKRAKLAKQHAAKREALKKVIASHDPVDLTARPAGLDELFLSFYREPVPAEAQHAH